MLPRHVHRNALLGLFLGLLAAWFVHLFVGGQGGFGPGAVGQALIAGPSGGEAASLVVWEIRLPRALGALFVGLVLGMVGAAFQALFRNPLAEPYLLGTSSGAALGGATAIAFGWTAGWGILPSACLGAAGAMGLVWLIGRGRGEILVTRLLLGGVLVGAFLSSLTTLVLLLAGQDANKVLRWLLGSVTPMYWSGVAVLSTAAVLVFVGLRGLSRPLNALAISREAAAVAGVNTGRTAIAVLAIGTLGIALTVGTVGMIGFVGLLAPHLARRVLGPDLRSNLLAAGAVGGIMLLLSDVLAQRLVVALEMPVGAVTGVLGALALFPLLRRIEA